MQIDLTVVISVVSSILSLGFGAWLATARIAYANREKEIDRRFEKVEEIDKRLHMEEKATIRQDGDLHLVQNNHDNFTGDLHEIKRNMATKSEVAQVSRTTEQILARLDGRRFSPMGGTYAQGPSESPSPKPIPRREPSRPDR